MLPPRDYPVWMCTDHQHRLSIGCYFVLQYLSCKKRHVKIFRAKRGPSKEWADPGLTSQKIEYERSSLMTLHFRGRKCDIALMKGGGARGRQSGGSLRCRGGGDPGSGHDLHSVARPGWQCGGVRDL